MIATTTLAVGPDLRDTHIALRVLVNYIIVDTVAVGVDGRELSGHRPIVLSRR